MIQPQCTLTMQPNHAVRNANRLRAADSVDTLPGKSPQPVGGEPEQLCCEGEGASERPPETRRGGLGEAPHETEEARCAHSG